MKKSILGIAVIAILVAMTLSSAVFAAGVSATPTSVEEGKNVTVTVSTETAVNGMEFTLTYDAAVFEYVSNTGGSNAVVNADTAGKVVVTFATTGDAVKSLAFTFKAKAEGDSTFALSGADFFDKDGFSVTTETVTTAETAKVTVEKEEVKDNTTTGNTTTDKDTTTGNTTSNTNKPTSIPQAGSDATAYIVAGLTVVAIAAIAIVRKK